MRASRLLRHPALLVLLALLVDVRGDRLVLTRSTVTNDYLANRMVDGKLHPQTYVFAAGRYSAGQTRDKSLERASFQMIAERLAMDLRQQEFHPAASLDQADLLLMVHWGVTFGRNRDSVAMAMSIDNISNLRQEADDAHARLEAASARADAVEATLARDMLSFVENQTLSEMTEVSRNLRPAGENSAALLGLAVELDAPDTNPFGSDRQKALHEMAMEERYFIIVMAYDARTLISTRKLKRVWTLRASISSAGVNFPQALDRMGNIASRYFGTRQDGVSFDYTKDRKRKESVTMGDIVVIGTVDP